MTACNVLLHPAVTYSLIGANHPHEVIAANPSHSRVTIECTITRWKICEGGYKLFRG